MHSLVLALALVFASVPILVSGLLLMINGNPENIRRAKNLLKNVFIGYIVILLAFIFSFVLSDVEVEPLVLFEGVLPSLLKQIRKIRPSSFELSKDFELEDLKNQKIELSGLVPKNFKEIKRGWLYYPFCANIIFKNSREEIIYCIFEPQLDKELENLLSYTRNRIFDLLPKINTKNDYERIFKAFRLVIKEFNLNLKSISKIWYYIERDSLKAGPITPFLQDEYVEDISCSGYKKPIYIYHSEFGYVPTNVILSEDVIDNFILSVAQKTGIELNFANPSASTTLYNGSRIYMTFRKDVTDHGSTFTVRKTKKEPITPAQLIAWNSFSAEEIAFLWTCLDCKFNILFTGETASGKTTALNAIALLINQNAKIISIEDTREIILPHKNWTPCVSGKKSIFELLKDSLRQRPEYIIVGEVRGEEAYAMFQAMSLGHATLSTFHGNDAKGVIERLKGPPFNVPNNLLEFLDLIVLVGKIKKLKTTRKCLGIWYLHGPNKLECLFRWNYKLNFHEKLSTNYVIRTLAKKAHTSVLDIKSRIKDRTEYLRKSASKYVSFKQFEWEIDESF